MKIIIVNGFPGSGKTTFEEYCVACNPLHIKIISTIDCIKAKAKEFGWDGNKTPESRKFLSELKRITTEFNDYSYNMTLRQMKDEQFHLQSYDLDYNNMIFFVDCREPDEIKKYVERLGATTLLMARLENIHEASNQADANIMNFHYDEIIWNNGTLENLRTQAQLFINKLQEQK